MPPKRVPRRRERVEDEEALTDIDDEEEEEEEEDGAPRRPGRPQVPGARAPNGRLRRATSWVGTIRDRGWRPNQNMITQNGIQYLTGQLEQGANQRLPAPVGRWQAGNIMPDHQHYQVYIETVNPVTEQELRALLGVHCAWFDFRRSANREDAIDYVTKEETRVSPPFEYGQQRAADAPQEYRQAINDLRRGATFRQMCENHTSVSVRYCNGLQRVETHLNPSPIYRAVQTHLYWGPPGSGKTTRVMHETQGKVYMKNNGKWWDGYERDDAICLDDFTGDLGQGTDRANMEFFKRITDGYGMRVECKGATLPAHWTHVYITSNMPMELWWPEFRARHPTEYKTHFNALVRRIPMSHRAFIGSAEDYGEGLELVKHYIPTVAAPATIPFADILTLLHATTRETKTEEHRTIMS